MNSQDYSKPKIKAIINHNGIIFAKNDLLELLGYKTFMKIKKSLLVSHENQLGKRIITRKQELYYETSKYFVISRFCLEFMQKFLQVNLVNKYPNVEKLTYGKTFLQLDDNQKLVAQEILKNLNANKPELRAVNLVMGTGLGKTYISCYIIRELAVPTLIVLPNQAILEDWEEALKYCIPDAKIGVQTGKRKVNGNIVLSIVNSTLPDKINNQDYKTWFKKFGFVVFDEIHNYTSASRQNVFWRANANRALGLTATPDENFWNMDVVFQRHIGYLLHANKVPGYNPNQISWNIKVHVINYKGPENHTKKLVNASTGYTSHTDMVRQFTEDPWRNKLVAYKIKNLCAQGLNPFVFFKTRDYAGKLLQLLESSQIQELQDYTSVLMGGIESSEYKKAEKARVILTTYSYGWQGISIPHMDAMILATPRKAKLKQIVGRILRKSGNPEITRHIIDIVDVNTKMGKSQAAERKHFYTNTELIKYEILKPEVWDPEKIDSIIK